MKRYEGLTLGLQKIKPCLNGVINCVGFVWEHFCLWKHVLNWQQRLGTFDPISPGSVLTITHVWNIPNSGNGQKFNS